MIDRDFNSADGGGRQARGLAADFTLSRPNPSTAARLPRNQEKLAMRSCYA
jgi:hypothetical protein